MSKSFTHIIDVSRRGDRDDMIPAQLTLVCKHEQPKQAVAFFRDTVNYWLQSTQHGKDAWRGSSADFNYGDLLNEQDDVDLLFLLKEAGFSLAKVERLDIGVDVGESYDSRFDGEGLSET